MTGSTKLLKRITSIWTLFSLLLFGVLVSCGDNQDSVKTESVTVKPESFTFFDLGTNTRLTDQIREELGDKLGKDAIERRSILNLNTIYEGFIERYLPQISELNRQINFPPGERVEHDIVRLRYHYPRKKGALFDYVELVFSEYTQTPLVFKINFREDETGIVETLKSKYGPPRFIDWQEENGRSMVWQKNKDLMIVSRVPDQFVRHGFEIVIYFVRNLESHLEMERTEEAQKAKSGERAF